MRLLNHQITTFQSVLVGKNHKFLYCILTLQVALHLPHVGHLTQLCTIFISVVISKLQNETSHRSLLVIRGHANRVLWDEDIRGNTTTAIDSTAIVGVIGRTRMFNAVLREEFSVLVTVDPVTFIILSISIWFLDTTPRRCVVTGNGQTDHGVIREFHRFLNKSLAERPTSHNGTTIIVLDRTSKDLRGRGRTLIDKHHKRDTLIRATSVGTIFLSRITATFGIDDELSLGQELISYLHSRLEIATRIATQIDNEVLEVFLRKLCQCYQQLRIGILSKVLHTDITALVVKHIAGSNTLRGDLTSSDCDMPDTLLAIANDTEFHFRVFWSFQTVHCLFVCHFLTNEHRVIDLYDFVACQHASTLCRSIANDILHADGILTDSKLDAYT